jgi:hypothetical protein
MCLAAGSVTTPLGPSTASSQARLRHPPTVAAQVFLCLETPHSHLLATGIAAMNWACAYSHGWEAQVSGKIEPSIGEALMSGRDRGGRDLSIGAPATYVDHLRNQAALLAIRQKPVIGNRRKCAHRMPPASSR